jgi:osmoprotectant transport system ATP-binding protein
MFRIERVEKSLGGVRALDGASLQVEPGETLVLIGPSGCGKSTLLRILLGLLVPDTGSVIFDGRPLAERDLRATRRRIGYVIQDGGLFPHMDARRNVTLPARRSGWTAPRIAGRLDALVRLTGFPADGLDRFPPELSGGQRQRVALMRALMLDPDALLLDEPLGALDPMVRYELQGDLRAIFRRLGKTVLLVTHDLAEAEYFGHRIALMRDGRIVQVGTPAELKSAPADAFVTEFLRAQRGLHALGGEVAP